ncbi:glycosyltransferase family 39 protein [Agrococcus sp. Marseille-P2731]|uniref:glycosyltransferase family 39 protein n=1 Tax=Agrococcus sp. Marseille-P2731 TaxID=1841862 RepID=UPI001160DD8C|nr:glycosyltransferase family 39 protein [Agrococcus sp. Marseille-P2731]
MLLERMRVAGDRAVAAAEAVLRGIGSRWMTAAIVLWLALGAAWIAVIARAGMVFDEQWHLESIAIYGGHPAPWFEETVPQEGVGAISRSNSYLYHFVMSFPDRWMADAGAGDLDRIVILRLLTVAMHAIALLCMIEAVRAAGVSRTVANLSGLAYAALPVTPFLAAQVNYDSAMLMLVAACGWVTVRQCTRRDDGRRHLTWIGVLGAVALGLAAVLTKFHAAPIVLVLLGFIVIAIVRDRSLPRMPSRTSHRIALGVVALALLVLIALCVERYVGNLLSYGSPSPDCAAVLDELRCSTYGVWERNRVADAAFPDLPVAVGNGAEFFFDVWVPRLMLYLQAVWFWHAPPLVSTVVTVAIPIAVISVLAIALVTGPTAPRRRALLPLVLSSAVYVLFLFWHNYGEWRAFGEPYGVQGRYLLPAVVAVTALAMHGAADSLRRARFAPVVLAVVALGMLALATQGGAQAFIISAQGSWYEPGVAFGDLIESVQRFVDRFVAQVEVPSI